MVEESEDDDTADLDPKDYSLENRKQQDHYKLLGLGKRRWRAPEEVIQKQYRKFTLRYALFSLALQPLGMFTCFGP